MPAGGSGHGAAWAVCGSGASTAVRRPPSPARTLLRVTQPVRRPSAAAARHPLFRIPFIPFPRAAPPWTVWIGRRSGHRGAGRRLASVQRDGDGRRRRRPFSGPLGGVAGGWTPCGRLS